MAVLLLPFLVVAFTGVQTPLICDMPLPASVAAKAPRPGQLHDALVARLKAMDAAENGAFHEDVTDIVAPYFQKGQAFADTTHVLNEQGLGPLRRFHGKPDSPDSAMYVSHSELSDKMFSDVYVTLDFAFTGATEGDMTLVKVKAFIQAPSM